MKKPLTPADVQTLGETKVEIEEPTFTQSTALSATELVYNFMSQNKIKPKLIVINELNVWDGTGFLINDKPLLKISYEYSKE